MKIPKIYLYRIPLNLKTVCCYKETSISSFDKIIIKPILIKMISSIKKKVLFKTRKIYTGKLGSS